MKHSPILFLLLAMSCARSHASDPPDAALDASPDTGTLDTAIPEPEVIPANELCTEYAEVLCAARARCDCPVFMDSVTCATNERASCESLGWGGDILDEAIEAGEVVYDGAAAARHLRVLESRSGCDWPFGSTGTWVTFGGAITGTRRVGAPCREWLGVEPLRAISECSDGLCLLDEEWEPRCHGFVRPGDPCSERGECFPHPDLFTSQLVCFDDRCVRGKERGERCEWSAECTSSTCYEGRCGPPPPEGLMCDDDWVCGDGHYCASDDPMGEMGTCAPRRELGASCESVLHCTSGICQAGSCAERACAIGAAP